MTKGLGLGTILILVGAGVAGAAERNGDSKLAREWEFTLGLVQKEVRIGMSQADLVSVLGSPNILTRDSHGRESWVYDKFATEAQVKGSGFGAGVSSLSGAGTSVLFGMLNGYRRNETAVSSQRTLTVVIRFDADGRVESCAFHSSRF
jgi:outer membrane protein assembly factor BamE (lipoprotein component of BamABCDE complex)